MTFTYVFSRFQQYPWSCNHRIPARVHRPLQMASRWSRTYASSYKDSSNLIVIYFCIITIIIKITMLGFSIMYCFQEFVENVNILIFCTWWFPSDQCCGYVVLQQCMWLHATSFHNILSSWAGAPVYHVIFFIDWLWAIVYIVTFLSVLLTQLFPCYNHLYIEFHEPFE